MKKTNFLTNSEFPNTAESLMTHPSAANACPSTREFVMPWNNPADIDIVTKQMT
ncbi:MAG TPA: hypothetical protein VE223_04000 [Nitrososphaeraceae archaeon]|nr:hypothetical protein [Nitrososphaeraceae archaeon]